MKQKTVYLLCAVIAVLLLLYIFSLTFTIEEFLTKDYVNGMMLRTLYDYTFINCRNVTDIPMPAGSELHKEVVDIFDDYVFRRAFPGSNVLRIPSSNYSFWIRKGDPLSGPIITIRDDGEIHIDEKAYKVFPAGKGEEFFARLEAVFAETYTLNE